MDNFYNNLNLPLFLSYLAIFQGTLGYIKIVSTIKGSLLTIETETVT